MKTNFLFIDESKIDVNSTCLYTLTSVFIRSEEYEDLRSGFHNSMKRFFYPKEKIIDLYIPELHFNNLLPDYNDETKLQVLNEIVDLLVNCNAKIFRVGYFSTPELKYFKSDADFYSACWFSIKQVTTELRKNQLLIPVIDAGFEKSFQKMVNAVSQSCRSIDMIKVTKHSGSISIIHSGNLGEPVYCDSKYSAFMQIVDCVSGLRNTRDRFETVSSNSISPYKQSLLDISSKLNKLVSYEENIVMKWIENPKGSRDNS